MEELQQPGERARVRSKMPGPTAEIGQHRVAFEALHHEVPSGGFHDVGSRKAVVPDVRHHGRLVCGVVIGSVATEHVSVAVGEHVRGASSCEQ